MPVEYPQPDTGNNQTDIHAQCPVCGGHLIEIRQKLQCSQCNTICETCCEGGQG
jgi:hypothetical protein